MTRYALHTLSQLGQEEDYCVIKNDNKIAKDLYTQAALSWLGEDKKKTRYIKLRLLSSEELKNVIKLR